MNILIISPSWEERSYLGFVKNIDNLDINKVIIVKYVQSLFPIETESILDKIKNDVIKSDILIDYIELHDETTEKWKALSSYVSNLELDVDDKMYLDITTMSRNVIWGLLFFLHQKPLTINIIYYQPLSYSSDWISKEPDVPRLLFKHSGIYKMGLPTALVILTGFDPERTMQLVRYYEPQKVILGLQVGEQFRNNKLNSGEQHEKACVGLIDINNICSFEFDAYSQDNGYEIIDKQIETLLDDYNIIVSSHGPKLSAISLYKCFLHHEDIALSYVPCKEYNKDYCKGIGSLNIAILE